MRTAAVLAVVAASVLATTTPAPTDVCSLPASEWLETEFMPELLVAPTGFNAGVKDLFRIVFTYHRKYFDIVSSSGALTVAGGELALTSVDEHAPTDCYDTYTVDVAWANLVTECARGEEGGASGFVTFTCKIEVDAKETLDPIRSTGLTREVHNEMPFIVKFPKQVTASVSNLSAFQPPNVLAAVIRQVVELDVSAVTDIDAKITLFTSTQWPFYLDTATMQVNSIPALITQDSFVNSVHCNDPQVTDAPNPTVNDALACSQQWILDLQVDATQLCEIDGDYQVEFNARCQPSFLGQTDCPLVQDDQGQIQNVFTVDFTIDSENFCAQVVDTVDVAATLASFKDHAHAVAATNYIQGQTAYFVTKVSSTKVTVVSVDVDDIDFEITGGPSAGQYSLYVDGANAAGALPTTLSLVVEDSAATGVQDEAYFQFLIEGSIFDVPADGSSDFEVTVVLNVGFKDAATGLVVLEQQQVRLLQSKSQQLATSVKSGVSTQDDGETAAAGALVASSAAAMAAVAAIVA